MAKDKKMEIKEYFNITGEGFEAEKHNILIPICLGSKFFTEKNIPTENVKRYLNWALNNTKDKVLFLVVDKIQSTNYFVRSKGSSEESSLRRVLRDGNEIRCNLDDLVLKFPENNQNKINVIQWEEYERNDPFCSQTTHLVYKEFKNNKEFRNKVLDVTKTSITDRKFREEQYWRLCDYILEEFSLCYSGVNHKGDIYELFPYPFTDSSLYFIAGIMAGEIFPKLNKKLPKEKVSWAILNEK